MIDSLATTTAILQQRLDSETKLDYSKENATLLDVIRDATPQQNVLPRFGRGDRGMGTRVFSGKTSKDKADNALLAKHFISTPFSATENQVFSKYVGNFVVEMQQLQLDSQLILQQLQQQFLHPKYRSHATLVNMSDDLNSQGGVEASLQGNFQDNFNGNNQGNFAANQLGSFGGEFGDGFDGNWSGNWTGNSVGGFDASPFADPSQQNHSVSTNPIAQANPTCCQALTQVSRRNLQQHEWFYSTILSSRDSF